ncbi:Serine/threonine protein kinase [Parasponia andersonii]|uniref:non-specific serine/threonine protein kinase n=1 Tax=Parasponia andersonii TaxID=3476 RepID=A0A2P5D6Y7_PARAD|nr:Serine/threonine protein kinase [Parasponia andersonii]
MKYHRLRFYCFFCVIFVNLGSSIITTAFGTESDKLSLLDLKTHLAGGDNTGAVLGLWNDSIEFCQWQGVTCSRQHRRVTILKLGGQGLSGTIPPSIGNLTFLRRMNMSSNDLHGTIPREIGQLSRLEHLDLSRNFLEGPIPVELTNCTSLKNITLHHNNLTGKIPFELGSLLGVSELWLGYNGFTGNIPSSIGNLTFLRLLSVRRNILRGIVPHELGRLKALEYIELSENKLSGMIPYSFCNLSSLLQIRLVDNRFSGNLMPDMGLCFPRMQKIALGMNRFTGVIPSSLANISGLELFDAASNRLSGPVPKDLGVLQGLKWFNIFRNDLGSRKSGDLEFLVSLTNLSSLTILNIASNNFGGELPSSIVNLSTQLQYLELARNQIHGKIPVGIVNLVNLNVLDFGRNYLTGQIPFSIGKLQKLGQLGFQANRLSGSIPSSIGNLTQLSFLTIDGNRLNGTIPLSLGNCINLQILSLAYNKFSGDIPDKFFDSFEQLISLHLQENALTGLSASVGSLKNLENMYVFDNKLSGEIPRELENLEKLEELLMAGNSLHGNIPHSLSSMKSIRILDFSHNNLSGMIPKDLELLPGLSSLNLSFNQLEGEVPTGGVFSNASEVSLEGNKLLCGGVRQLKLPACSSSKLGRSERPLSLKIIFAITIGAIVFFSSLVVLIIFWRRPPKRESTSSSFPANEHYRVSYNELYKATEGFASSNLIGTGSFGTVYKGILSQSEQPVAIKVLNLQQRGASKSFFAECEALRRIRHRNLLKIITSCSSADFKGNDFMALVFDFMPNGSLEDWLHVNRENQPKKLNFGQILDVAVDIASALDYLHHHCEPPIVHCDLKPSNILLDNNLSAHLGDFGLAKLLVEANETNLSLALTNSVAIKGSIGYIAPEYGMGGEVSTQGDAYSYGILVLEMITGRRPTDDMFNEGLSLNRFCEMAYPDRLDEIVDPYLSPLELDNSLKGAEDRKKLMQCLLSAVEVGLSCSAESAADRMDVRDGLTKILQTKETFNGRRNHQEGSF